MAGRLVLVVDAPCPSRCSRPAPTLAATLADQTGMPVTRRHGARRPTRRAPRLARPRRRRAPARVRAAAGRIRRRRCPRRRSCGRTTAARTGAACGRRSASWRSTADRRSAGPRARCGRRPAGATGSDGAMLAEMRRGIWETTGLYAESAEPGWLAITCDSPTMAAWMCAAIILENVDARVDDDRLLLPAGPGLRAEGRGEEHHHGRRQDPSLLAGSRRRRRAS